jgi:hypothetical protein
MLHRLLLELRQRAAHLEGELQAAAGLPAPAEAYRVQMAALLGRARAGIDSLAAAPDLLDPSLVRDNFRIYKRLAECVSSLEWGPVTALKRFRSPDDALLSRMVERLCHEVGYPFAPPLCVAGGYSYYFTYADMNLIVGPASEPFHLLGLPDVYHELGHIVTLRRPAELAAPAQALVESHFTAEIKRARQDGRPDSFVRKLRQLRGQWKAWLIEFTADVIAAYLTGPAYGWANVRLCSNVAGDVFEASPSHPADDARATAISLVLGRLGAAAEAAAIGQAWSDFLGLLGKSRSPEFDVEFPAALIGQVADLVVGACGAIGLRPFRQQPAPASGINVTRLLGEAWQQFNADPGAFGTWEAGQVAAIRAELGV